MEERRTRRVIKVGIFLLMEIPIHPAKCSSKKRGVYATDQTALIGGEDLLVEMGPKPMA